MRNRHRAVFHLKLLLSPQGLDRGGKKLRQAHFLHSGAEWIAYRQLSELDESRNSRVSRVGRTTPVDGVLDCAANSWRPRRRGGGCTGCVRGTAWFARAPGVGGACSVLAAARGGARVHRLPEGAIVAAGVYGRGVARAA